MSYKGEISLHSDLLCLHSCRARIPLLRVLIRIRVRAIQVELDLLKYYTLTHLFSFLGIEDVALIIDNEARA